MTLAFSLSAVQGVYAQSTDVTSEPFIQAALTLMTFDYFATKCKQGSGFTPSHAAKIEAWQTANGVGQLRLHLRELDRYPTQKQKLEQAVVQVTEKIAEQGTNLDACNLALLVSDLPNAQFATVSPQLLAPSSPSKVPQKVVPSPTNTFRVTSSPSDSKTLAQIDRFGFNSRTVMGIGGFLTTDIYPVVLFRNGDALTDVKGLSFAGGIEAHKRAHPGKWTRWRRQGGKLQLTQKGKWNALSFPTTYPKLPDNFKLDGLFRSLSGTGTVAIGGSQSVSAWRDYRFWADGRVVRGGGAGGRTEGGGSSTVTSSTAPNQRGRYRVQGLTLQITYEDGSEERRILITDPKNSQSAIWLDGIGYTRRKQ